MTLLDRTYPLIRRLMFSMDAEDAHERTLGLLESMPRLASAIIRPFSNGPSLPRQVGGVDVLGPVGLAAGLDKDGRAIPFWPTVGFGFVEVGTVTMHPQPGNARPRLFRIVEEAAIINRMGFNNLGSQALANRLQELRDQDLMPQAPVGANLGKSKVTEFIDAPTDYATSARRLRGLVSWFTINVSSPNTPGLRGLQDASALKELLPAVVDAADGTPVWLKLAPDLNDEAIRDAVSLAKTHGIRAIVATNTTIRRDLLAKDPNQAGGLSGRPLGPFAADRILAVIRAAEGEIDVVGVGGIETVDQAQALLDAGCKAIQLYTAFIYQGPGLPSRLNRGLRPSVTT